MAFSSTVPASLQAKKPVPGLARARFQTFLFFVPPPDRLREIYTATNGSTNAKLNTRIISAGGVMKEGFKTSLLEKVPMLILLGILAGAIGGLGIGVIQMKTLSSSSAGK